MSPRLLLTVVTGIFVVAGSGQVVAGRGLLQRPSAADIALGQVLYRPTGAAINAMAVEEAVETLRTTLVQLRMEHQGQPIVDIEVDDGTVASRVSALRAARSDPGRDRTFGAAGPEGGQAKGVLVIRTGRNRRASVVAVAAIAPMVLFRDNTTYLSGDGLNAAQSTSIAYARGMLDQALIRRAADALAVLTLVGTLQGEAAFQREFDAAVIAYRAAAVKPAVPETARRLQVQASVAVRQKDFRSAIERFSAAIRVFPPWPEAHFDLALQHAAAGEYANAIIEMNRFLALVPGHADARAAQDQIYEWEVERIRTPVVPYGAAR